MGLQIRHVKKSDADTLLSLLEDARKFKLSLGDNAWGDEPYTPEEVTLRVESGSCYLVEVNDIPAGSVVLRWEDKPAWGDKGNDGLAGYIHGLIVHSDFRGQQLGPKIIGWAADQIRENGRKYVRLDCPDTNVGLCSYYEKLGFKRMGIRNNAVLYQRTVNNPS